MTKKDQIKRTLAHMESVLRQAIAKSKKSDKAILRINEPCPLCARFYNKGCKGCIFNAYARQNMNGCHGLWRTFLSSKNAKMMPGGVILRGLQGITDLTLAIEIYKTLFKEVLK